MINYKNQKNNSKLLRLHKHHIDFFIADDIELSGFRDEMASMEHPFFALKGGDKKTRRYKSGSATIVVAPNVEYGMATVFDKDLWIYSMSKLQELINYNKPISHNVCFTPYDFFMTTNKTISGRTYKELERSLERLAGTRITTNIIYSDKKQTSIGFGLIDSWRLVEEKQGKRDIGMVEIKLPEWLYQALCKRKVLKISQDYFHIRKAIDRRIYEIVRKHCGNQREFSISLEKLHHKTGSRANKSEFKRMLKNLASTNDLPDYNIYYHSSSEIVIFNNKNLKQKVNIK